MVAGCKGWMSHQVSSKCYTDITLPTRDEPAGTAAAAAVATGLVVDDDNDVFSSV